MQTRNWIDGHWSDAFSGVGMDVIDPASGAAIARVPKCGSREALIALNSAFAFQPAWESTPATQRASLLKDAATRMIGARDSLARLITLECGKPLEESAGEVAYAADFFLSASNEIHRLDEMEVPLERPGVRGVVRHRPVGVCAAITPWNFPLAMLARKVAPALAAGCSMLVKPAEETPLCAFALVEILLESGFPHRCIQVLSGDAGAIATAWLADGRVRKLSFTGSTETGRILMAQCVHEVVRCSMELGGHSAFIVLADADIEWATQGALKSKFRNAGQTCISPNRFLVHADIVDQFADRVAEAASRLTVAPGMEPGCHIGPLINDAAVDKVRSHVAEALARGGRLLCGGKTRNFPNRPDRFYEPTVIANCSTDMLCFGQETFGPVIPIMGVSSEQQAIDIANASPFGLAGYVFGGNEARSLSVAKQLQCGVVGVNEAAPSNARAPFGGVKWSGYGREGGPWGLMEYVTTQYLANRRPGQ